MTSDKRQKPTSEAIQAIRDTLNAPVLKNRQLRPAEDIAAPLRENRGGPKR